MPARKISEWEQVNRRIISCERCPRLRQYCQVIAAEKRASYSEWDYWGQPVPNFGDPAARLLIVGLAPAAHGGNRTGRVFTGDRSGDWLYKALHKAGFANQPLSRSRDDGLELNDCAITNPCHCAPPENKPTAEELGNCAEWFQRTFDVLPVRVIVALGQLAWQRTLDQILVNNWLSGRRPKFAHGAEVALDQNQRWLFGCFHPSPRNTNTGKLTESMFDAVFHTVRRRLDEVDKRKR